LWSVSPAASVRGAAHIGWCGWPAKYSPEITLRDLTERFSYDCLWRAEASVEERQIRVWGLPACLEHRRPPDLPPGMVKLPLVKGD
jgi:hypothetical protein